MRFAMDAYVFTKKFPKETVYFNIDRQLIKCSSSSAANYHAVCRAKTKPDFINKLRIVEEELDESMFWFEYTCNVDEKWHPIVKPLSAECNELISIVVSSIKTALGNQYK